MPAWLNIILAFVGGTGLMGLITTTLWNKQKIRLEKIKKLEKSAEKEEVRGIIKEEVKPILDILDTLNTKLEANSEGTVTLLRDRMKHTLDEMDDMLKNNPEVQLPNVENIKQMVSKLIGYEAPQSHA